MRLWILRKRSLAKYVTFELYLKGSYIKAEKENERRGKGKGYFWQRKERFRDRKLHVLFKGRK